MRHPLIHFALILTGLALAACGTSSVQMVVVQPALLNARPYGGSVSLAGFQAMHPDYAEVAGQMRLELQQRILQSVGGVVALREYGGGLVAAGQVDDYSVRLVEGMRAQKCQEDVEVEQNGVKVKQSVERDCPMKWFDWHARVAVLLRVTTAQGQVLYLRHHVAEMTGKTDEQRDRPPLPKEAHATLQKLRAQVVDEMAQVLSPQRVQVTATFYDCEDPAESVCEHAVKFMANSQYDQAVAAYTEAIRLLTDAKVERDELAKVYWNRGVVYEYSRQFDLAIADYRKADELDPGEGYLHGVDSVERTRIRHEQLIDQGLGAQ
jgi:tetratricopeptide (TPR) repeat protein